VQIGYCFSYFFVGIDNTPTDVYIYFWSFEIYGIKNYVKALYLMKQHYSSMRTKSSFFLLVEKSVSMLIES